MIALLADENFCHDIITGLKRREPSLDIVRVQDVGLRTKDVDLILDWAASHERVLLTHDRGSMEACVRARCQKSLAVAGVIIVRTDIAIGRAIEDILMMSVCGFKEELQSMIWYVPM